MTPRGLASGVVLVAVAAALASVGMPRARAQAPIPTLTTTDGAAVIRQIANAEAALAAKGRDNPVRYRPLVDIIAVPDAAGLRKDVTVIDSENGTFKGYLLRVTAQGSRFEASLVPDESGCGSAFFLDERTVTYIGQGWGCDANTATRNLVATAAPETLSQDQAVRVMRDVGTTEVTRVAQGKEYGNLSDVVGSPAWTDSGYRVRPADLLVQVTDSISAEIVDKTLWITTSSDGKHFQSSLVPTHAACGSAFFLDDRFFGYRGKKLGC